jgi:AraC-like DNA-binding protein
MDPFSDIITLLRPSTAVAKPIGGRGRWAVRYAAHDAPGFTIVLKGECWVGFDGQNPVNLQKGDFLLLPSTPAFTLSSHSGMVGELRDPTEAPVRHGDQDGDADFVSLGGTFRIEQINATLLLSLLPHMIRIPASEGRADKLHRVIQQIMEECENEEPGKELILQRLLEVLLIEALRWRGLANDSCRAGLLNGLLDPGLSRVLRAMHADVRTHWTVADLAKVAGHSRSAFAARFSEVLGCGPIEYLSRWRMALAKDGLMRGTKTLDRIADEIGYESATAFSTAFRKRLGCSPGRFARSAAVEKVSMDG